MYELDIMSVNAVPQECFLQNVKVFGTVIIQLRRAGWGAGDGLLASLANVDLGSGREILGGSAYPIYPST